MKCLIQRVTSASVTIDGNQYAQIGQGIVALLGIAEGDTEDDIAYIVRKLSTLRIFNDESGRMNASILDRGFELLLVSQFTLYGNCEKGRRPSFDKAMKPEAAKDRYHEAIEAFRQAGIPTETGLFGAKMAVQLINDGPVTLMIESPPHK